MLLNCGVEGNSDCKEIQPINPKGNQSWIYIGKTDAEAETPILWPLDVKNWLIGKDTDAGKDWRQGEKGTTEDEMVGWHQWQCMNCLCLLNFYWKSTFFFSGNYLIPCSFSRNSGEGDNSEFDLCDTKKQVLLYGLSLVMTQWILKIYDTVELH